MILQGDAQAIPLRDNSVDAIVTDPPYGLEFMGQEWDAPWKYGMASFGFKDQKFRNAAPQFSSTRNPMCRKCHKHKRGSKSHISCKCDVPDFDEIEHTAHDRAKLQAWHYAWAVEALRILKPGGHLIAFGGERTYHRMACAVEDAGFEVRFMLLWITGQGFPKSLNVSKAIDKAAGANREVVVHRTDGPSSWMLAQKLEHRAAGGTGIGYADGSGKEYDVTVPATDAAKQWDGWGTALKPAATPIILARKPLSEPNVAANILKWGTGAINIDGCRVAVDPVVDASQLRTMNRSKREGGDGWGMSTTAGDEPTVVSASGRWPANVILDEEAAALLDEQTGDLTSGDITTLNRHSDKFRSVYAKFQGNRLEGGRPSNSGGASRFFYCSKADRAEREIGLDCFEVVIVEYETWEGEVRKARLRVDMGKSPPRVIDVSGTLDSDALEWSTFLFGNGITAPSLLDIPSITATTSNLITTSETLNYLVRWLTREHIAVRSGKPESGGSPAESAACSMPLLTIISARTESLRGAGGVASATRWKINGNVASPADHPTVKPVDLMAWLCRLVTPPHGLILDPFVGSGSTGIAALRCGFRFIGLDKDPKWVVVADRRIVGDAPLLNRVPEARQ